MEFRILGPLEVSHEDQAINVGGPRQQAVLAMLLLEANHVIPVDRLISAIWDEEPPNTARAQVQICISTLRRQITTADSRQLIDSRRPGYLLKLDEGALDSDVFEAHIAAGRSAQATDEPQRAAAEFRTALARWRGQALSGVRSKLVQQSAAPLNERRLTVLEECLESELRVGMHHDLVGELVRLVEEHPLRERLRALLMTALYKAGRQAEALDAYRHTRNTFMDELGLEPGKELQRLQHAILNGSPVLEPVLAPAVLGRRPAASGGAQAQVPRLLPATIPDFCGRSKLVDHLVTEAEAGPAGDTELAVPVNVITGPAGAGKTTLALHVAHQLAPRFPDGQVFARLRTGNRQVNPADVLERFLRTLGVESPSLPEGLEERAEMYRSLLGKRKMLIVLDDAMSERQVAILLPGGSQCSVIVTSRGRLTGMSASNRVELGNFSHRSAVEMLTRIVGEARIQAEPEAVTALCELCGYLPLGLRIVAARLAARPHWSVTEMVARLMDETRRLDELNHGEIGVRASVSLTYEGLSPDARRLFRRLALLDVPDFASWVGSPLLQTDTLHAEDLLEELTDAYMIDAAAGPAPGLTRYRFPSVMLPFARERLAAEENEEDRRKALERLVGALLYLAGEAHRREQSGDFLLFCSDASRWPLPDPVTSRLLEDPLAWYQHERLSIVAAIHQAAASGLAEHSWNLALSTVTLIETHACFYDWRETYETALKAACRADDRRGEAAMRYLLGSLYMSEGQTEQAARQFAHAHALYQRLSDRYGAALVLRNQAFLDRMNARPEEALARWDEALGTFQVVGDRIAEAYVLHNMARVHLESGEDQVARNLLDRAERICTDLGNRRVGAQVLHRLGELYLRRGDLALATEAYGKVLTATRESDDRVGESYALLGMATVHLKCNKLQAATRALADAGDLTAATGDRIAQSRTALALAQLHLKAGRLDEAAEHAERAMRNFAEMKVSLYTSEALFARGQIHLAAGEMQADSRCGSPDRPC